MKAFISYSSLDATVANEIVSELERNDEREETGRIGRAAEVL